MTSLVAQSPVDGSEGDDALRRSQDIKTCGGAPVLDLALCLILAVTVVGLLLLAL